MQQDAQARHRWHPLGDGYRPQPGDWVLFDGHVEVVTRVTGGALSTIGADSRPGLTVNAHTFPAPFGAQGVLGFVDNGGLVTTASHDEAAGSGTAAGQSAADGQSTAQVPGVMAQAAVEDDEWAAVPGASAQTKAPSTM